MSTRPAQILAAVVEVCCPYCGEPRPDPEHGSHQWEPRQLQALNGDRVACDSCDRVYILFATTRAQIVRDVV